MHVAILTNYNLYESKRYFCKHFAEALHRLGIETTIIDLKTLQDQAFDFKRATDITETTFTCSFNTILPDDNNQYLPDASGVPHIAFLVDPAIYYREMLRSKNMILTCVDHFDCNFIKERGFKNTFFWGHGIESTLGEEGPAEKVYDVVLIGSCYDHETLQDYWRRNMTPGEVECIEEAIDIVLRDNSTPLYLAVRNTFLQHGLQAENPIELDNKIAFYATFVDNYTRGKDRTKLIRSIKNAEVHVFGSTCWRTEKPIFGWNKSLEGMKNVVIHSDVTFPESLRILKQSKICLNSMPFFKNGTHERLFTGLACHSLPITSDNLWVRNNFRHQEDILIYAPQQWDKVNDWVDDYLGNPQKLAQVVAAGREKVMKEHTWDVRVRQLFTNLEQIRLA
jgi:hypothetical protein